MVAAVPSLTWIGECSLLILVGILFPPNCGGNFVALLIVVRGANGEYIAPNEGLQCPCNGRLDSLPSQLAWFGAPPPLPWGKKEWKKL